VGGKGIKIVLVDLGKLSIKKKHSFYGIFIEGLPLDMFWQLPNSKE
jgi:hypothetical protein